MSSFTFRVVFGLIDGLDGSANDGKKLYLEWKRGSNSGKTDRVTCKNATVTGLGEIGLKATLHASSKKGEKGWEAKYLSVSLRRLDESPSDAPEPSSSASSSRKRRVKPVTICKGAIDLASYANQPSSNDKVRLSGSKSAAYLHIVVHSEPTAGESSREAEGAAGEGEGDAGAKGALSRSKKSKSGSRIFSASSKLFGTSSKSKKRTPKNGGGEGGTAGGEGGGDSDSDEDVSQMSDRSLAESTADDTTAGDWSDDEQLSDAFHEHQDEREVPLVIQDMIALLSQSSALSIQGLLQLKTSPATIDAVLAMYKAGCAVSEDWTDYPAAANVLKTVLSSRDEPLLPKSLLPNFLEALHAEGVQEKVNKCRVLVSALPPAVYVLLAVVTELLWKITLSPTNHISSHNVTTIFLEAYFRSDTESSELKKKFEKMQAAVELVELLVQNFDKLFAPVSLPEHSARRLMPAEFHREETSAAAASMSSKSLHKRGSSLSLLPLAVSQQGKPTKYRFKLIFQAIHDLMPVDGPKDGSKDGPKGSTDGPVKVMLRWKRGKKSRNHGHTPSVDTDASRIVRFPAATSTVFSASLFRSPKGQFCPKAVEFEIVYEKDGKSLAVMSGSLDLSESINVAEASGDDTTAVSTESIVSFPSLISTKSPPTKLLVNVRAACSSASSRSKARSKNDHSSTPSSSHSSSSSSLFKRLSTTFSESPVGSADEFDMLDGPSQDDVNLYVMMANTIASHEGSEVFLQDWITVQLVGSEVSEKRWAALTYNTLILFRPYTPGKPPSPTDPKDVFHTESITEIEYGVSDVDFGLGTPMGKLNLTLASRKKRDLWVAELRRIIPLVKQEAGRVLRMSAQDARRMIDQLTKQLAEAQQALGARDQQLQDTQQKLEQLQKGNLEESRAAHQHTVQELQTLHQQLIAQKTAETESQIRQLREKLTSEALAEQQRLQSLLTAAQQQLEARAKELTAREAQLQDAHQKAIQEQRAAHQSVIGSLESRLEVTGESQRRTDLALASTQAQAALLQKELEESRSSNARLQASKEECAATAVELQGAIDTLRKQLVEQQQASEKSQKKAQKSLHDEQLRHEDTLREAKKVLEAAHANEISQLHHQLGQSQGAVVQELTAQIEALKAEASASQEQAESNARQQRATHSQTVEQLEAQHLREVEALRSQMQMSREEAEQSLQKLRAQHVASLEGLQLARSSSAGEIAALQEQHRAALETAAEERTALKSSLKQRIESLREEAEQAKLRHSAALEALRVEKEESAQGAAGKSLENADLKARIAELEKQLQDQLLSFQIAQKSQHEIRKLFFAKHSWDGDNRLLDAKRLFKMFRDSCSFQVDSRGHHKHLESILENIVDVLEQNRENLPLLMFYLSFTLTLLDLVQEYFNVKPLVSQKGLRDISVILSSSSFSSASSSSGDVSWQPLGDGQSVEEWFMGQLSQIASRLVSRFFLPTVYSQIQEISVNSILFSEQYAIFEGSLSSKTPGEEVTSHLTDVISAIESNHIFLVVAEEIIRRVFYRIESHVFNTLLESPKDDVVTAKRGFQIKMALSEIDSWLQSTNTSGTLLGAAIYNIARSQLLHIRAASMVLVTATNAEIFKDAQVISNLFTPLTFSQVSHLMHRYKPERSSPEPVPAAALQAITDLARGESNRTILLPIEFTERE